METNETFQALTNNLNEQLNKQLKDRKYMKTLLITTSKSSISKSNSYELLNLATAFLCSLYFTTRTVYYTEQPLLFWTGLISSFLWIAQFSYSLIGYRKLSALDLGQDPITTSIRKITLLLSHYDLQKKIYLWLAPITISAGLPIPLFCLSH